MLQTLLYLGSRVTPPAQLRNPIVFGDDVYFEKRSGERVSLIEVSPGLPGRVVAELERKRHSRTLIACEHDGLICREDDDTLVLLRDGGRIPLRRLVPAPRQIVVTPEHVVWTSGQVVWRWWRQTDTIDRVAECEAEPLLAARPVEVPYPASRIATDIVVAAGNQLGLLDAEGLDWTATLEESATHLACTTTRIVVATGSLVQACELATERIELLGQFDNPIMALAASETRAFVGINRVDDDYGEYANVTAIDLANQQPDESRWSLEEPTRVRISIELAVGPQGVVLVESARDVIDRATFLPFRPSQVGPLETLRIQRWLPDGRGGEVAIAQQEWSAGAASGELAYGMTAKVNEALRLTVTNREQPPGPGFHGWQVSIANHGASSAHDNRTSPTALAIERLIAILAPHVAPLAALAELS